MKQTCKHPSNGEIYKNQAESRYDHKPVSIPNPRPKKFLPKCSYKKSSDSTAEFYDNKERLFIPKTELKNLLPKYSYKKSSKIKEKLSDSTAESDDDHKSVSIPGKKYNILKNLETSSSSSEAKLKKSIAKHQTPKALLIYFDGFGANLDSIKNIKNQFKNKYSSRANFLFYGEDENNEPLEYYSMIGALGMKCPVEKYVGSFLDRVCDELNNGEKYEKVIFIAHSFGAFILSEFLEEINRRSKNNDLDSKKFNPSLPCSFIFNRPFTKNSRSDLNGCFSLASVLCREVSTNKEAIKRFQSNESFTKSTFILTKKDGITNYEAQLKFIKDCKSNITIKIDDKVHNDTETLYRILKHELPVKQNKKDELYGLIKKSTCSQLQLAKSQTSIKKMTEIDCSEDLDSGDLALRELDETPFNKLVDNPKHTNLSKNFKKLEALYSK